MSTTMIVVWSRISFLAPECSGYMARQSSDESVISMRQYKDRVSEGSPFRNMLSVGARRIGAGFRGKHSPDVIAAAVKRTNFIISNEVI